MYVVLEYPCSTTYMVLPHAYQFKSFRIISYYLIGMDPSRMQDQLMRNPEMMQQIMSSPMMDNLLSNPDMLRSIMQSNPQIVYEFIIIQITYH